MFRLVKMESFSVSSYLTFIILMGISVFRCLAQEPIVNIPGLGGIRGSQMSSSSGKTFYAFRGIPYAEPPVGELRFQVTMIRLDF